MLVLQACGESLTYRYRLTIEVDTPEGLRTGSSVIETTTTDRTKSWGPPESRIISSRVRGEAVFVDLGEGRNVVALLAHGDQGDDGLDFDWLIPGVLGRSPVRNSNLIKTPGVYTVPPYLVPTLVTFKKTTDPSSGLIISKSDFPRIFGPGYAFRRAIVEILASETWTSYLSFVNENSKEGIAQHFPWLSDIAKYRSDPNNVYTNSLPKYIGRLKRDS